MMNPRAWAGSVPGKDVHVLSTLCSRAVCGFIKAVLNHALWHKVCTRIPGYGAVIELP